MIVVRVVQRGDVDALMRLAQETGPGLTTFKPDRDALAARVERARRTMEDKAEPHEAGYFFVMEDTDTGDVAGVCGIETAVGLQQPFYNYRVSTVVHASQDLGIWTRMSALNISHDLTGYAEVCSLFLSPRYRTSGVGGLLSRSRFMFLAQFRERFPQRLCAELAELMPRYPVYVELLPEEAQQCVGLTHSDTIPARRMLEAEGLRYENHVDIFDAGPVLECHIADLRTVRESVLAQVEIADAPARAPQDGPKSMVSNTSLGDFRVGVVAGVPQDGVFRLSATEAAALDVKAGDLVRVLPQKHKQG
jgi:arginine N-succinyltransferase